MRTLKTVISITILLFLTTGQLNRLVAQQQNKKVIYENNFDINSNASLVVNQEFGKMVCSNWDKETISVKVTARWKTGDASKAQKMIDKVELHVRGDHDQVVVFCKPGKQGSNENNKLSLEIEIFMPKSINLRVKQKFGFTFIETVDGTTDISCEYGTLNINKLNNNENKIRLAFGDGSVQHLTAGNIKISYSGFEMKTAGNISVRSEYSDINITQKVRVLRINLEGGNLEAGKVAELMLEAKYANVEIDELSLSMEAETAYGSVVVDFVSPGFQKVSIQNRYGSVELGIDPAAVYAFEAESTFGEIEFPESQAKFSYRKKTNSGASFKGVIGQGKTRSEVSIENHFGQVSISN
ncbi:MAG: DUF4097 domain-containing protein [Bacteroidales bacterium]|nr:DUF4097 domain-containing protein [Bacteroidales bacterium]